jgi:predicted acetyltransferase
MADAKDVSLRFATDRDAALLANLLELYIHDLSEWFPIAVGADGRFGYPRLARYWVEPGRRFPFVIEHGGECAGFALVTRGSPATTDPNDLDVAEFFVLRRHRRAHVGARAAELLWDRLPGRWTVRVSEGNRRGLAFWPDVIAAYARGSERTSTMPGRPFPQRVFEFDSRYQPR